MNQTPNAFVHFTDIVQKFHIKNETSGSVTRFALSESRNFAVNSIDTLGRLTSHPKFEFQTRVGPISQMRYSTNTLFYTGFKN